MADIYPPEVSSAAHLMQEFAEGLKKRGHNIWVLTSYPRHYLPKNSRKVLAGVQEENSVNVIRAKTLPLHKVHFFIRGISQLLLPFLFFWAAKKIIKEKIDVVIVYSPPLPLALIGGVIKRRLKAKFILLLEDIFPQNAIDLGILSGWSKKPAVWLFEAIERRVYRDADAITFHSEGGRKFLIEHKKIPPEKIVTIPNWVDLDFYSRPSRSETFRGQWSLTGKFVFLFGGILGPAQGLEFLVEAARNVTDLKDVVFLLVGDGMEKTKIESLVASYGLSNVIVKPFVTKDDYASLVQEADVGLVCLSAKNATPFIPGKFLGYLAAGKPVLAFLNKESDGFTLVKNAQCGMATIAGDLETAVQAVRHMEHERGSLDQQGRNGLEYAKRYLSLDVCLDVFEKFL